MTRGMCKTLRIFVPRVVTKSQGLTHATGHYSLIIAFGPGSSRTCFVPPRAKLTLGAGARSLFKRQRHAPDSDFFSNSAYEDSLASGPARDNHPIQTDSKEWTSMPALSRLEKMVFGPAGDGTILKL